MVALLVADASVIIKAFVAETDSALATEALRTTERVVVPAHALAEVVETFERKRRNGLMTARQQEIAIDLAAGLLEPFPLRGLVRSAATIAGELTHSVYDTLYLAAAIKLSCPLLTADDAFVRKAAGSAYAKHLLLLSNQPGPP